MSASSSHRILGDDARPALARTEEPANRRAQPLVFVGFEISLETAGLDRLDLLARSLTLDRFVELFRTGPRVEETVLLTTCHRVEIYSVVESPSRASEWLHALPGPGAQWRIREGREAVRHLFRVAAGRESMATGEQEVREQVRAAAGGILTRYPRPLLRPVLLAAVAGAADISPTVPRSRSIAALAATRLLELVASPFPRVLVIGTGVVGRQVAEMLAPGARVTLAYRQHPPDPAFLRAIGGRAVALGEVVDEVRLVDAVVTAAKSGSQCLRAEDLPTGHPMVLVDLGVPRNIDPAVRRVPGITLVDVEDLRSIPRTVLGHDGLDRAVDRLADQCSGELCARLLEPWAGTLRREAETVRRTEIEAAQRFLGTLEPGQEVAVDRLTRRLVERLIGPATARVRSLPEGAEGDRLRQFAIDLLRPRVSRP